MPSSRAVFSVPFSPRARLSYLALSSFSRRCLSNTSARHNAGEYKPDEFRNQPHSNSVEIGQKTRGPLGNIQSSGITPKVLKEYLDEYVVGHEVAKKLLASQFFNHLQRIEASKRHRDAQEREVRKARRKKKDSHPVETDYPGQDQIVAPEEHISRASPRSLLKTVDSAAIEPILEKSNILITGPTGVGKSYMISCLARRLGVPFVSVDVTTMTQAGYIGANVESCIEQLFIKADYDKERSEMGIVFLDEIDKIARPPGRLPMAGRDVSGEGVQQALLKMLEGSDVQITPPKDKTGSRGDPDGFGAGGSTPESRPETVTISTNNILFVLAGAFVGLDKPIKKRISSKSIGFGADIADATPSTSPTGSVLEQVSPQLYLKHVRRYMTPEQLAALSKNSGPNILDLAEPSDFQAYGFIHEFVGRVPVHAALAPFSADDLVRVLTEPNNSIIAQYKAHFQQLSPSVELEFTPLALQRLAKDALSMGTGARALRSVVEGVLQDAMYEIPGSLSIRHVLVHEKAAMRQDKCEYFSGAQRAAFLARLEQENMEWDRRSGKEVRDFAEWRSQGQAAVAG